MENKNKQRFSIKKLTVGVASIFLGTFSVVVVDSFTNNIFNNSAYANENIKDGILYEYSDKSIQDFSLNNATESALFKIQGVNKDAAKDSISLVVEKEGPISVSISSPVPNKYAETVNNITTLKLGSFTEGSYYSIPIFTKYNENTPDNTPSTIKVKVVDNVTQEVLYEKVITKRNRASDIVGLKTENEEIRVQAGKFNIQTNTVVENNLSTGLKIPIENILSNPDYPKGGDYVKSTITSGENSYEINEGVLRPKNYEEKVTTPVTIRFEVFDVNNVSKNIFKEVTIIPEWEDIEEFTTYTKVESAKNYVLPKQIINNEITIDKDNNKYIIYDTENPSSQLSHKAYITKPIHKVGRTTNKKNVNYIDYYDFQIEPKELKMTIKEEGDFVTNGSKFFYFATNNLSAQNYKNIKLWYRTKNNNDKQYFLNNMTIYEFLNNLENDLNSELLHIKNYSYIERYIENAKSSGFKTLNDYLLTNTNTTLDEVINDMSNIEGGINIPSIDGLTEIGVDFLGDTHFNANIDNYLDINYNVKDEDIINNNLKASSIVRISLYYKDISKQNKGSVTTNTELIYKDGKTFKDIEATSVINKDNLVFNLPEYNIYNDIAVPKVNSDFYSNNNAYVVNKINNNIITNDTRVEEISKSIYNSEDKKIKLLFKKVLGLTTISTTHNKESKTEIINSSEYDVFSFSTLSELFDLNLHYEDNSDVLKIPKLDDIYPIENIDIILKIPKEIENRILDESNSWEKLNELNDNEYIYLKYKESIQNSLLLPEAFTLEDKIYKEKDEAKANITKDDILVVNTIAKNITDTSVDNLSIIQAVPKINMLSLSGEIIPSFVETNFDSLLDIPDGWEVYYSTTIRNEGENVLAITDWNKVEPVDKSKITYLKWVNTNPLNKQSLSKIGFKTIVVDRTNVKKIEDTDSSEFSKIKTVSGFNLGNNTVWGESQQDFVEIKPINIEYTMKLFLDKNNNGIKDENEIEFVSPLLYSPALPYLSSSYSYETDEMDNNPLTLRKITINSKQQEFNDSIAESLLKNIYSSYKKEDNLSAFEELNNSKITSIGVVDKDVFIPSGFDNKKVTLTYFLSIENGKEPLIVNYYNSTNGEIIHTETLTDIEHTHDVAKYIKVKINTNDLDWKIDNEPKIKKSEYSIQDNIRSGLTIIKNEYYYVPYFGKSLVLDIPMKLNTKIINVKLVDKATNEVLKTSNIVANNYDKNAWPDFVTIGDKTYKKVEKPDLPTEAVVPGETDNADIEFEYELVRGAVYGVFKAENGNNIIKDKVTIIEGGQPEDTTKEYTAPSKITDDNGKVWELVSPTESVSYTNGENATEHILTYREVKKNITLKYVTESGEAIKEETVFENKSVGSKYTINTPKTITKGNVIYNVSGEREISGLVEDNDNIVTIQVTPKQKQVAIIKFVEIDGEELSGIERKRVEGYDGTNINVTLENIPNYRITNNPFETVQVFDTDNSVDQEFNVVLERIPTTAIQFETEYVADETREYGSENITEREGVEGTREDNGEVTRHPVNKVVKVATGSKVERKETPFNVIYETDESKAFGDNNIINGKNKVEEVTTTYTLNTTTGVVTPNTPTTVLVEAGNPETHTFGTKSTVTTEDIPFVTEYVGDNTIDYGKENVNTEGVTGVKTTTTTYKLNGDTVVANESIVNITKQPINKVIAKGTKTTETVINETLFTTITKEDSSLTKGKEVVEVEGVNGKTVNITEYTVNKETGEVTSTTREEVRETVNKVVRVGVKETTTNIETDTLTANEEKAKEDKHSDAWEEAANKYNKKKETVEAKDSSTTQDKKETIIDEHSKGNNSEVKVENKVIQATEVKAKELPKTNTNNTLLYTATTLIGLATLLSRKQKQ